MKINVLCPDDALEKLKNCLPLGNGNIGNIEFILNGNETVYDGIIVLQSTSRYQHKKLCVKDGNSLMVVMEPPDILRMPSMYINQFDHVLTPNCKVRGVHTIESQFGQIWTVNKSYQSLAAMKPVNKTRYFSTVTSTKVVTRGHKQRLKLACRIQQEFFSCFDWYGRGVREIKDKWDAIAPYRYHLIFENGRWDHYWTEKLTDAFMGFSLPIYVGCPNITDYFAKESIVVLDDKNPCRAIDQLKEVLERDAYTEAFEHILVARNKVIHEYSIFNVLVKFIDEYFSGSSCYKVINLHNFENIAYRYNVRKLFKKYWYGLKKIT